jgi:monovalent cation:H+ antiporter-2, CPA2 family
MHALDLILMLAGGLGAALVGGYVTHKLGLSPIVGYLMAGILVGPHTPGFVADQHLAEQLAEVGVILLMFGIGLHFHFEDLLAVRRIALPGALLQSAVATALGALVAQWFGWSWSSGLVFGLALSVASTVVLVRVLSDNNDLHTPTGHIAVGWLVVEDLFTVLVLVLMPAVFVSGGGSAGGTAVGAALALAVVKVIVLVALVGALGGRVVPWILNQIAATRSRELFTLAVLVIALGLAVGATTVFGVSMALGAFLAGMVVGRSEFSVRAAADALPMRDAFAVLFFVSVGMLLDPLYVLREPVLVAATLAVVLIAKPLAALAIAALLRYPLEVSAPVAVALAQIGEFSFIVAGLGNQLGVLTPDATNTIVAAAIASITVNPMLYAVAAPLARRISRRRAATVPSVEPQEAQSSPTERFRAVVVGHGPVGRTVARLLRENRIDPTVIELNVETVRRLQAEGIPAVYGDASHADVLAAARIAEARSIALTVAGLPAASEIIRIACELNPRIQVLARSASMREQADLRRTGAHMVFSGEAEVALAFAEAILSMLGASPDQIERERARVHTELDAEPRFNGHEPYTQSSPPGGDTPPGESPLSSAPGR